MHLLILTQMALLMSLPRMLALKLGRKPLITKQFSRRRALPGIRDDGTRTAPAETRPLAGMPFSVDDLPEETMFIIDGTALLYNAFYSREHQAYYTEAEFTESVAKGILEGLIEGGGGTGTATPRCGALTAMCMIFARFVREVRPRYLAVAFDTSKPSFRAELYPAYKATRKPPPADLVPLFDFAPRILSLFGARCFQLAKYEADDIMATLSKWSRNRGLNVVHVSIDKDMLQLVEPGVHAMSIKKKEVLGVREVTEKFGVSPERLTDFLSLVGDSADNIKGVPGIGPKSASALMGHFGDIRSLYEELGLPLGATNSGADFGCSSFQQPSEDMAISILGEVAGLRNPKSVYSKLRKVTYEELVHIKRLITLRDDIHLEDMQIYREDIMSWGFVRETVPVVGDQLQVQVQGDHNQGLTVSSSSLTTSFFRYRGERIPREAESLMQISASLEKPLNMLRQQYSKLDRIIE